MVVVPSVKKSYQEHMIKLTELYSIIYFQFNLLIVVTQKIFKIFQTEHFADLGAYITAYIT